MIFDLQSMFSDGQAVTATAPSTNVIDLGAAGTPVNGTAAIRRDLGAGYAIPIRIQVTEDFATLTSLTVSLQTSSVEGFGSDVDTVATSGVIAAADLVAGYVFNPQYIPQKTDKRYVRLNYTVAGTTATAGKITAGITCGHQTN